VACLLIGDHGAIRDGAHGCRGYPERIKRVKKYILFDHDGVLVDTEFWYYKAGERALADIGLTLDKHQYGRAPIVEPLAMRAVAVVG
jgi:hypothetical protein